MSCRTNYNNSFVNIRTSVDRGPVQSMYNYRLTPLDTHDLEEQLRNVFDGQTYSFKINISYGFILRNKQMGRYIYFHSSYNFCGRFLDEPSLVTNLRYFEIFLQQTTRRLPVGRPQTMDSAWVVAIVTNATFFVNKIVHQPIACVSATLHPCLKHNKAVIYTTPLCVSFSVWLFIAGPTFIAWNSQ